MLIIMVIIINAKYEPNKRALVFMKDYLHCFSKQDSCRNKAREIIALPRKYVIKIIGLGFVQKSQLDWHMLMWVK
jgi:hypothetical protein